jgi:hypothetical protein
MKICAHACYQGQAYYAFTGFRILHYKTWLFRFLGSEICFKGHFGHKGGPESKIEGPKEQDSSDSRKTSFILSMRAQLRPVHARASASRWQQLAGRAR